MRTQRIKINKYITSIIGRKKGGVVDFFDLLSIHNLDLRLNLRILNTNKRSSK